MYRSGSNGSGSQQPSEQMAVEKNWADLGAIGRDSDGDLNNILDGQHDLLGGERYQLAANDTGTMSDVGRWLVLTQ